MIKKIDSAGSTKRSVKRVEKVNRILRKVASKDYKYSLSAELSMRSTEPYNSYRKYSKGINVCNNVKLYYANFIEILNYIYT